MGGWVESGKLLGKLPLPLLGLQGPAGVKGLQLLKFAVNGKPLAQSTDVLSSYPPIT